MIEEQIRRTFATYSPEEIVRIEKIPRSGSNRQYFRIYTQNATCIATYNLNKKENEAFILFSRHFAKLHLPIPHIYAESEDGLLYLQEDLGRNSLLNYLEEKGHNEEVFSLYKKSLSLLARLQIQGHQGFDYSRCLTGHEFGRQNIMSDLLYFKYYFLDTLGLPYDKKVLLDEFEALSIFLAQTKYRFFMFRDFQSRNIIIQDGEVHFIDYQGGMNGALQYDVASLLWQARANLSEEWKHLLLEHYISETGLLLDEPLNKSVFIGQYQGYVLIRLLQVLGAYGFRGLFERKDYFLTSIPVALNNLKSFLKNNTRSIELPELDRVLQAITTDTVIQRFSPVQADEKTVLIVEINSFSYRKGIPVDNTESGGGFVFDCRGILNPGRIEKYKKLSGQDKPVQDYLEQHTLMPKLLNGIFDTIDISVENYIERGFDHLQINFGCTGGQHRSVYAAIQTTRHLQTKYKVKVVLAHTNQHNWVK